MKRLVRLWQLPQIPYQSSLNIQNHISKLHHQNSNTTPDTLLLLEHPPVYTTGIRTKNYSQEDEQKLKQTGAEFFRTNRGGLITFHGPGQLVAYPILNLKRFKPSMRWYVSRLEETVIDVCRKFGLKGETSPHTGVWIEENKVCAIGVHGSRFVTTHGLALNCCTDLKWFEHIVPCGIKGKGVTSLSRELGKVVKVEEVVPVFVESFCDFFECSVIEFPVEESCKIFAGKNVY